MRATLSDAGIPQAAASYDAWGVPETPSIASFGFTGELQQGRDVWLRARWYGAGRGSFGTRDPYAGDAETPYSMQYYQYAYANPALWTDPSGRSPDFPTKEEGMAIHKMIQADFRIQIVRTRPGYTYLDIGIEVPVAGASKEGLKFELLDGEFIVKGKPTGNDGKIDIVDLKAREVYEIKGVRSRERGKLELLWYLSRMTGYHAGTYIYVPTPRDIGDWPGYPDYIVRAENRNGVIIYWAFKKQHPIHVPEPEYPKKPRQCKEWYDSGECSKYYEPGELPLLPLPQLPDMPVPQLPPFRVPLPVPLPVGMCV